MRRVVCVRAQDPIRFSSTEKCASVGTGMRLGIAWCRFLVGSAWKTGRGKDTPLVASFVGDTGGAPALHRWQFGGSKMRGKAAARALAVAGEADANKRA